MKKLFIKNLKHFFEAGFNNQFQILSELEKSIQSDELKQSIAIFYSNDSLVIFDLVKITYGKNTTYTYEFTTTAS